MTHTPIILIGPMGAGKSTIGILLAERLKLKRVELDEIRWDYYDAIGYDRDAARQLHEQGDLSALAAFFKPLEAQSVVRAVAEYAGFVIDFGAGQSVYEDDALLTTVKNALNPLPNVILLLPSPDIEESIRILHTRIPPDVPLPLIPQFMSLNEQFVRHPSNGALAKIIVYTQDRTPEQTCDEIIGKLK